MGSRLPHVKAARPNLTPEVTRDHRHDPPPLAPVRAGGPTFVQVRGDLYAPGACATCVALWVDLAAPAPTDRRGRPSRADLAGDVGRRDRSTIGRHVDDLHEAGWVRRRRRARATFTITVLRRPEPGDGFTWTNLPLTAVAALRAGTIGPEHLLALLRWHASLGRDGHDRRPLDVFAARWGQHSATVRRHRTVLLAAGLLEQDGSDGGTVTTALPGRLPEPAPVPVVTAGDPAHETASTARTKPPVVRRAPNPPEDHQGCSVRRTTPVGDARDAAPPQEPSRRPSRPRPALAAGHALAEKVDRVEPDWLPSARTPARHAWAQVAGAAITGEGLDPGWIAVCLGDLYAERDFGVAEHVLALRHALARVRQEHPPVPAPPPAEVLLAGLLALPSSTAAA